MPIRNYKAVVPQQGYVGGSPYGDVESGGAVATAPAAPAPAYQFQYPGPPNRAATGSFSPNTQTSDINRMWRDNRTDAIDEGNAIDQQTVDQYNRANQFEDRYRFGTGMQSPGMEEAYGNLWNTPGYTSDEAGNIIRDRQFNGLITPDSEYSNLNPTDAEASGIRGNTGSYTDYFDPDQLRNIDVNSANMQRGAVQQARTDIGGALDAEKSGYAAAIDPGKLGLSSDYYKNTSGALNSGTDAVRGTIDAGKLRYDPSVAEGARMTDRDVQDLETQAGRTVGNRYASLRDSIKQGAVAQGNADALAIAAAGGRLNAQEAATAGDAMTDARIKARGAQAERNMALEQQRIGAEQGYAGLASGNEQEIASRTLGQANLNEQNRLNAERDISNRQMDATGASAGHALAGGTYLGSLAAGTEGSIGANEANTGKYIASTGTGIRQAQDTANSGRALNLYGARQGNAQFGIQNKFGQGMAVNQQLSGANKGVADARRTGQEEYRNWTTGQTGAANTAAQNATSQRIGAYGARTGATNSATSGLSNWEIGNQDNTVLNKSLKTIGTLSGAASSAAQAKRAWG